VVLDLLRLSAGFALLILGAHRFVEGAVGLAARLRVPALVVGLTVVAVGTSLPELSVNVSAALNGTTALAAGNALGSNILNILVILGIAALIRPMAVRPSSMRLEVPLAIGLPLLLWPMAWGFSAGGDIGVLSRWEGMALLTGGVAYFLWLYARHAVEPEAPPGLRSPAAIALLLAAGMALLAIGSQVTVTGALHLARAAGLSEAVIGLTVVAFGTSLPELATSAMAAWRGNADIAVGNILGSNIFNILLILGVTGLIRPIPFTPAMRADLGMTALAALLLWLAVLPVRGHRLGRPAGAMFLLVYAGYAAWTLGVFGR
jgi:cation:H+ antiporter